MFFVNDPLKELLYEELRKNIEHEGAGGFLPAVLSCCE